MLEIREYLDEHGSSPFSEWFGDLHAHVAAKVAAHLVRLSLGNYSHVEPVGSGVHEKKIDWGPGLRVYFGQDGDELVILLAGSEKKDQRRVIKKAHSYWKDYKARKRSRTRGAD